MRRPAPVVRAEALEPGRVIEVRHGAQLAQLVTAFRLTSSDRSFGGFSGVRVRGREIIAVSDRGTLWRAVLDVDNAGRLLPPTGWSPTVPRLPGSTRPVDLDIESVTIAPGGGLVLALEQRHALLFLEPGTDRSTELRKLPATLRKAPGNEGAEALAAMPDGRLLVAMEGLSPEPGVAAAAILGEGGSAILLGLHSGERGFVPTDAVSAGGMLYVLERRATLFGGLRAIVLGISLKDVQRAGPGAVLHGAIVAQIDAAPIGANFEGIAQMPAPGGATDLILISDDDFGPLLSTLLVQIRLLPYPPSRRSGVASGEPDRG